VCYISIRFFVISFSSHVHHFFCEVFNIQTELNRQFCFHDHFGLLSHAVYFWVCSKYIVLILSFSTRCGLFVICVDCFVLNLCWSFLLVSFLFAFQTNLWKHLISSRICFILQSELICLFFFVFDSIFFFFLFFCCLSFFFSFFLRFASFVQFVCFLHLLVLTFFTSNFS